MDVYKHTNESTAKLDEETEAASKAVVAYFAPVHAKLQQLESEVNDCTKEEGILDQFATTLK